MFISMPGAPGAELKKPCAASLGVQQGGAVEALAPPPRKDAHHSQGL